MRKLIQLDEKRNVVLISENDDISEINMDTVTSIDYGNIYGEAVTCAALMNKIGIIRADAQAILEAVKLECNVYESELKKNLRKEALLTGGKVVISEATIKLTENSLSEIVMGDKTYQVLQKRIISAEKDLGYVDSLYWALQSKDKKLNNILPKVTPKEFFDELIEGVVNTITIKKIEG